MILAIRLLGKKVNLKTVVTRKHNPLNFPKNEQFLPLIRTRTWWCALLSWYLRFGICLFALLLANYSIFCKTLLEFIKPFEKKTYHINNSVGIKWLTRIRLSFSHLHERKFRHNFKDELNRLCSFSIEPETTAQFFVMSLLQWKPSNPCKWLGKSIFFYTKRSESCRC